MWERLFMWFRGYKFYYAVFLTKFDDGRTGYTFELYYFRSMNPRIRAMEVVTKANKTQGIKDKLFISITEVGFDQFHELNQEMKKINHHKKVAEFKLVPMPNQQMT